MAVSLSLSLCWAAPASCACANVVMIHPGLQTPRRNKKRERERETFFFFFSLQTDEKGEDHQVVTPVRVGVEGVETDEELLTGSKDRWHFPSVPILFACHFLSHLVFFFFFFFFCHKNLICYPLAGRNALLLLPPRPWPPLERQQKAIRNLFFLSFFLFFFTFQQLGQGRKLVGCRRWRCFACYIRRRGAG